LRKVKGKEVERIKGRQKTQGKLCKNERGKINMKRKKKNEMARECPSSILTLFSWMFVMCKVANNVPSFTCTVAWVHVFNGYVHPFWCLRKKEKKGKEKKKKRQKKRRKKRKVRRKKGRNKDKVKK
jgi:polyferredoxin